MGAFEIVGGIVRRALEVWLRPSTLRQFAHVVVGRRLW